MSKFDILFFRQKFDQVMMCPVPCAHRDARIFVQRDGNQHFCSFTSKQWNSAAKHENSVDRMRQGKFRGAKIFRYTSKLPRLTIQRNNKSFGSTFFCIWQRFRCSHEIKLMQKTKNLHLWRKKNCARLPNENRLTVSRCIRNCSLEKDNATSLPCNQNIVVYCRR